MKIQYTNIELCKQIRYLTLKGNPIINQRILFLDSERRVSIDIALFPNF